MTARDSPIRLPFSASGGSLRPFAVVVDVCSPVCKKYSRAYIHCLVTKVAMGSQLLSYHNLFYMMTLVHALHDDEVIYSKNTESESKLIDFKVCVVKLFQLDSLAAMIFNLIDMNDKIFIIVSSSSFSQTAMASEKEAALAAVPSDSPTIFDKILNKQIPANFVYEDDKTVINVYMDFHVFEA
ncbi:hypothetical protein PHJA_001171600 [Phtheirospermum japonicum]|uniref:tRNA-guanine(15) transglycosylase-like domain-containing protein n=1 Tax=Phtheirospermum japonicum TaxID=374723 RepID=A0A830BR80_9LAMI|nr:hypothetical protein PHJA_001171600 [Phtheirospermum japonicum]